MEAIHFRLVVPQQDGQVVVSFTGILLILPLTLMVAEQEARPLKGVSRLRLLLLASGWFPTHLTLDLLSLEVLLKSLLLLLKALLRELEDNFLDALGALALLLESRKVTLLALLLVVLVTLLARLLGTLAPLVAPLAAPFLVALAALLVLVDRARALLDYLLPKFPVELSKFLILVVTIGIRSFVIVIYKRSGSNPPSISRNSPIKPLIPSTPTRPTRQCPPKRQFRTLTIVSIAVTLT